MKTAIIGTAAILAVLTGCESPRTASNTLPAQVATGSSNTAAANTAVANAATSNTGDPLSGGNSQPATGSSIPAVDWQAMPALTSVQFVNAQVGFIGGKGVLLETRDGGHHWTKLYAGSATVKDIDFVDADHGYVVFTDFVWETQDGGMSWERNSSYFDTLDMVTANVGFGLQNGSVYAIAGNFKATRRTPPVKVDSISFVSSSTGYASGQGQLYATTNGGLSWKAVFRPPVRNGLPWKTVVKAAGDNLWLMVYGGDGGMSQLAYVVYHSQDGGQTWNTVLDEGYFSDDYGTTPRLPTQKQDVGAQPGPFTVGPNGSAHFIGWYPDDLLTTSTTDGGVTFTHKNGGSMDGANMPDFFSGLAVSFPDAQHGWIVGQRKGHGIAIETDNGGASWRTVH